MPTAFEIAGRKIGPGRPTYVIAEISANHNGSLARTKDLIARAKDAGADAVKIQTYTADTMTIRHDGPGFVVQDGPWKGRHLHELYDKAHLPWEWHAPLFEHAKEIGITLFSTPFDSTAVQLLESLHAPAYKIASFELTDIPLITEVARTGKPMILSTGMANREEITDAVNAAKSANASGIVLLHCVSGYPSLPRESNLRNIENLANTFGVVAGLSDHTLGSAVSVAAAALGASVIEKHFTLRRTDGGEDSHFSLEPEEFKRLCEEVRQSWEAVGEVTFEKQASESGHADYRRSLYVVESIKAGEPFTAKNIRAIRPGFGLAPKYYDRVMQSVASADLPRGTPLKLEHLRAK
jgi:N-acetylneuraminate synthase